MSQLVHDSVTTSRDVLDGLGLLDTIQHETFSTTGSDGYLAPTYNAAVSIKAFVEKKQRKVAAADGTEQISQWIVTIPDQVSVDPKDRITLPNGDKPPILTVESPLDPDGNPYSTVVTFGHSTG